VGRALGVRVRPPPRLLPPLVQSWAVYGFTIAYRYTQDPAYLAMAQNVSGCYIEQVTACCRDYTPLWDFFATGEWEVHMRGLHSCAAVGGEFTRPYYYY
jgi:hypothetical protein